MATFGYPQNYWEQLQKNNTSFLNNYGYNQNNYGSPFGTFSGTPNNQANSLGLGSWVFPSGYPAESVTPTPSISNNNLASYVIGLNSQNVQPQGLFAQAKHWWNNSSFQDKGAALQGAVSTATSLWDMYQENRAYKLAKAQWEEQKALQRANYTNSAKAMNALYRDQQSGRSTTLMSNSAKQSLRNNYQSRKVKESYW